MLWNFVSSTGVNSIITLISTGMAVYAIITARLAISEIEMYNTNLKKADFLKYVKEFHDVFNEYNKDVFKLRGKMEDWDKAGRGNRIINEIVTLRNGVNEYYNTIPLPENLKNEFLKLDGIVDKQMKEQPSFDRLVEINAQLKVIDQALSDVADSMKVKLLS